MRRMVMAIKNNQLLNMEIGERKEKYKDSSPMYKLLRHNRVCD
jgi:FtsZ-binding cell division protein ZapB